MKRIVRLNEAIDKWNADEQAFINMAQLKQCYREKGKFGTKNDVYIDNRNLNSLLGSPLIVDGDYHCHNNHLVSLIGGPEYVGLNFNCTKNKLESLEYGPQSVIGRYLCQFNNLKTLNGMTQHIGGYVDCSNNKLQTLEGSPTEIHSDFLCDNNELISLKGAPKIIGRHFLCNNNPYLKTLQGLKVVKGDIHFVGTSVSDAERNLYRQHRSVFNLWLSLDIPIMDFIDSKEYREALMDSNLNKDIESLWN